MNAAAFRMKAIRLNNPLWLLVLLPLVLVALLFVALFFLASAVLPRRPRLKNPRAPEDATIVRDSVSLEGAGTARRPRSAKPGEIIDAEFEDISSR